MMSQSTVFNRSCFMLHQTDDIHDLLHVLNVIITSLGKLGWLWQTSTAVHFIYCIADRNIFAVRSDLRCYCLSHPGTSEHLPSRSFSEDEPFSLSARNACCWCIEVTWPLPASQCMNVRVTDATLTHIQALVHCLSHLETSVNLVSSSRLAALNQRQLERLFFTLRWKMQSTVVSYNN